MPTKGRRAYRGGWERRQPTSRVVQVNDGAASHDGGAGGDFADRLFGYVPALLRFARSFTGSAIDAEDLVQDTLVRALRSSSGFRGEASELTWLRRILRNLAIDRARRPHREVIVEDVEASWADDAYTVDPALFAERLADRDDVLDALSRLSHRYRSVVVLHDMEGWTIAEVAAALDLAVPATKARLRRGRLALVTALADGAASLVAKDVPLRCWDARRHVEAFLDGTLSVDDRGRVERHLAACPTCPPLVAALVGVTERLGELRDADNVVAPGLAARLRVAVFDGRDGHGGHGGHGANLHG